MKRVGIISCLLAASLCAFAYETVVVNGAMLKYTADAENKATITGAEALPADGILIIPDTFRVGDTKYTVTSIKKDAFIDPTNLRAVAIPTFVTNIGENAFAGCTNLEWVVVRNTDPKTNVSVDATAFPNFREGSSTKLYLHDQYWGSVKQNTSGMIIGLDFGNWLTFFAEGNIHPYAAVNLDPKDLDAFYGSMYFRTYAFTVTWPEGVQAFTATAANNSLNMNAIPRVGEALTIPADNGVILRRERVDEGDNISFILLDATVSEPAHITSNDFSGCENYEVDVQAPSYVLYGDKNHGVGFYQFGGAKYQAFRAFYHPASPSASPSAAPARISLVFNHTEEATGVEEVPSDQVQSTKVLRDGQLIILRDGKEYNAQGQSLQERRAQ